MKELKQFIIDRPGLIISWLEDQCSMPRGTIRTNNTKPIPIKYKDKLTNILKDYGYTTRHCNDLPNETTPSIDNNTTLYWMKKDTHLLYYNKENFIQRYTTTKKFTLVEQD